MPLAVQRAMLNSRQLWEDNLFVQKRVFNVKNIIILTISLVVLSFTTKVSYSQTSNTGNSEYQNCKNVLNEKNNDHILGQGKCLGIMNTLFYFSERFDICTPKGSGSQQATRILVAYLDKNPDKLHKPIYDLAIEALKEVWPC